MEPVDTPIDQLKPHPRNYREHPDDQLEHLAASITEHGFYRNIVVARDHTILAGHGVVQASREKLALSAVPVVVLDIDPDSTQALKILAGDNETGRLAGIDDRALSEILREIQQAEENTMGLLGTGYDEHMLSMLVLATRHSDEIPDLDAASAWAGMPDYQGGGDKPYQIMMSFDTWEERDDFLKLIEVKPMRANPESRLWSAWWPNRNREDVSSVHLEAE